MEDKEYGTFEVSQRITAHSLYYAGKMGSEFYVNLRDKKKIIGSSCPKCKKVFWPPRSTCGICFSKLTRTVEIGPLGTLETYTQVTYSEPIHPRKAPFIIGIVKLDDADTALTHFIDEVAAGDLYIGMRLKPVFARETKGNILDIRYFRPL